MTLILAIIQIICQKSEFVVFKLFFLKKNIDNFATNHEIDFLHQISVFSQKSVSEEYYHNLGCMNGIKMCNMAFERKFSLVIGKKCSKNDHLKLCT